MGGGKEQKRTNQLIEQQRGQQQQEHANFGEWQGNRIRAADERAGESRAGMLESLDYRPEGYTPAGYNPAMVKAPTPVAGGRGIFEEFGKTGGLSEGDRANIRSRATSVIPAFYSRLRDEGDRQAAVQGGYGPGRMALMSRLAREEAGGAQEAATNAEVGIANEVRQGRMYGASGMQHAGEVEAARQDRANYTNAAATNAAGLDFAHRSDVAASNLGERMDTAAARRTGALSSLAGREGSEAYGLPEANLAERGLTYGAGNSGINQRIQNNPRVDWWNRIGSLVGAAGGAATGIGALGFGRGAPR